MRRNYEQRLNWLSGAGGARLLQGGRKGLEKESLRIDRGGRLSYRPHPPSLGAALTHPYITTDYSEALLEFVTPAGPDTLEVAQCLSDIHQFAYAALENEMLWAASMPCLLHDPDDIPIAYYGTSNLGRMKTAYRRGLSYRYRPAMQAISGVHFNYSLPEWFWPAFKEAEHGREPDQDFVSARYMGLIRNFRRYGWLVLYLFGASPVLCKSFLPKGHPGLEELGTTSWYGPHATSLRMSDLGYQNKSQSHLTISLNSLDEYIADLTRAISTPNPLYEKIGVRVGDEYRQLNANNLQIENEYYTTIRPKRRIHTGERPTLALRRAGVEYVELRALDVAIEDPIGTSPAQLRFLEAFLIFCLLRDAPPMSADERAEINARDALVACKGRCPGLSLPCGGGEVSLAKRGAELLDAMVPVCEFLDADGAGDYRTALQQQQDVMLDPERTPSARILQHMAQHKQSFFEYGLAQAIAHREHFEQLPDLAPERQAHFEQAVADSLEAAQALETRDEPPFEAYLANYFRDIDRELAAVAAAGQRK